MEAHDSPETLHYCDPPYVHDTRSSKVHGHHGYTHEMSDEQHRTLAGFLHSLGGMVILSGYDSELYGELYGDWKTAELGSLADGARKRKEILWINKPAWQMGMRLF
jgi:DNA adenine methylase